MHMAPNESSKIPTSTRKLAIVIKVFPHTLPINVIPNDGPP